MRILIISYYFAPQNAMGAVRPTKLAKYLSRMGHEVTVLCGTGIGGNVDATLKRDLQDISDVHMLHEWSLLRSLRSRRPLAQGKSQSTASAVQNSQKNGLKKLLLRLLDTAYIAQNWLTDEHFRLLGVRELSKLHGPYDVVFSSYAPFSVHLIARAAKKRGLAKRWIADHRDEVGVWFGFQEGRKKRYLSMIRREADGISAVSQGFLEMMRFDSIGRVLSNGFDREDLPEIRSMPSDKFRVVYCGQMQDSRHGVGGRDITPLFATLRKLISEGELNSDELELIYAGREGGLFTQYASSCGLEMCVTDHGQVSRDRSLALQQSAHLLLMASLHTPEQRGILTGKLFEYLMMDKPIVCCMSGTLVGSGVKRVLEETEMGFCFEKASGEKDEAALLDYMRRLIVCWRRGKQPPTRPDKAGAYAYPALAEQLESWMKES